MSNAFDDLTPIASAPGSNAFDDIVPPQILKQPSSMRTPGGLYHFRDASGQEIYSKDAPPAGATAVQAPSPLDGANWGQRAQAGYGAAAKHTLVEGPEQAYYRLTGNKAKADEIGQQVANERETEAPLLADKAGATGNFAGSVAPLLAGPEGFAAGALFNAGAGALQPVAEGDSRLMNTIGGAAGSAVGSGISKGLGLVAQPVKNALTDTGKAAVQKLINAGVPLDVAQRTGSEFLQRIKSGLSSLPVTAGWVKDSAAEQKRAFTVAALKSIGADGERASPEVMSQAKSDIGDVFNESAKRGAHYDSQLENDLQQVQSTLQRTVPTSNHGPINTQINDILDSAAKNDGKIDGSVLQRVHSDLGSLTKNSDVGGVASQMRSALVSAQARASTPEEAAALTKARTQYRNLKQIEPSIREEEISPRLLAGVQRQKANRSQSIYGTGDQDLPDLAKAGASVLHETLGDSGTAGRHSAIATLGAPAAIAAPLLYAGGHSLLSGEPIEGEHIANAGKNSAYIAATLLAAKGAKGAFSSKAVSDYLTHGIGGAPESGFATRALRSALTAPEKRQLLANALKGTGANALRPAALPAPAAQ